ncbi:MAG TPA: peptidase M23, partial [Chitinophagaceae bacterium]|nr:peptidase M23 [Chitinophagaceae bacterium]
MGMSTAEFEEWIQSGVSRFQAVVPFDPTSTVFAAVNLTASNTDLSEPLMADTAAFSAYMQQFLAKNGADYGIGGYNELRTMYGRSDLFDGEEPRRLHLGLDIWGPADTSVYAPLGGVVHS